MQVFIVIIVYLHHAYIARSYASIYNLMFYHIFCSALKCL